MREGKPENLISLKDRSTEIQREIQSKGGIKSGESKREKKLMSQIYAEFLISKFNVKTDEGESEVTGSQLVDTVMKDVLKKGGSPAVSMMKEIREATEGNKIDLSGGLDITSMTPEEREKRVDEIIARRTGRPIPN